MIGSLSLARMTHWRVTLPLQRPTRGSLSRSTGCYHNLVAARTAASRDYAGAAVATGTAGEGDHGL